MYLIVGLPGAGKTTRAKELEDSESALRPTADDWQMAIFHDDGPTRWRSTKRGHQRDLIEGKLVRFQPPDQEELHGATIPPVPPGHATWVAVGSQAMAVAVGPVTPQGVMVH